MKLKHHLAAAAVIVAATLASVGLVQIRAAQEPVLSYCPSHAGAVDCATAIKLFLQFGKPSDDELVPYCTVLVAFSSVVQVMVSLLPEPVALTPLITGAVASAGWVPPESMKTGSTQ